jgi:hypothetical protein
MRDPFEDDIDPDDEFESLQQIDPLNEEAPDND